MGLLNKEDIDKLEFIRQLLKAEGHNESAEYIIDLSIRLKKLLKNINGD